MEVEDDVLAAAAAAVLQAEVVLLVLVLTPEVMAARAVNSDLCWRYLWHQA